MSRSYAIQSLEQARAYLAHPLLGARLRECCQVVMNLHGKSARDIFGAIDEMKFRASLTLFAQAEPGDALFCNLLERYYDGATDQATLAILADQRKRSDGL